MIQIKSQYPIKKQSRKLSKTSSRADPIESVKLSNKIHNKIDKRNEEINKEIEKNPNAKFGLVIGEEPGKSEFSKITKDPKKQAKDDKLKKKKIKL